MMGSGYWLAALAAASAVSVSAVGRVNEVQGTYFHVPLDPGKHEYEVSVARRSVTTLLFPREKNCVIKTGDTEYFGFQPSGNRVGITANTENTNRSTNVTVHCGDIDLIVFVKVVKPGPYSGMLVDFRSDEEKARKHLDDIEDAREEEKETCRTEKKATATSARQEVRDTLLSTMASRANVSLDREHGRNRESLIVHVDFTLTVGTESFMRFTVENGTRSIFNLGEVKLYTENTNKPVSTVAYQPISLSLGVEQTAAVAIRFPTPLSTSTLRLVVTDAMGRSVEVNDIEL
jgi:hypothetical protein